MPLPSCLASPHHTLWAFSQTSADGLDGLTGDVHYLLPGALRLVHLTARTTYSTCSYGPTGPAVVVAPGPLLPHPPSAHTPPTWCPDSYRQHVLRRVLPPDAYSITASAAGHALPHLFLPHALPLRDAAGVFWANSWQTTGRSRHAASLGVYLHARGYRTEQLTLRSRHHLLFLIIRSIQPGHAYLFIPVP